VFVVKRRGLFHIPHAACARVSRRNEFSFPSASVHARRLKGFALSRCFFFRFPGRFFLSAVVVLLASDPLPLRPPEQRSYGLPLWFSFFPRRFPPISCLSPLTFARPIPTELFFPLPCRSKAVHVNPFFLLQFSLPCMLKGGVGRRWCLPGQVGRCL